jgi:methylphosphotriester-DNA--protein-cysteine methyltransferase
VVSEAFIARATLPPGGRHQRPGRTVNAAHVSDGRDGKRSRPRAFAQETGKTITGCLRELRLERAAQLLRSGRCNVTEAALEVGYNSMSHFSQAFCQTKGCCPNLYPLLKKI